MTSERKGKIISLTYHEITQDPRVLKQARVLQQSGYDVHVFCDWPDGLPEYDDIDGVQVTRFRCYHHGGVTAAAMAEMGFLDRSRDEVAKRYIPYAKACEHLEEARPFLERKYGVGCIRRAQSTYFKECTGPTRLKRMFEYFYLTVRLQFTRVPAPAPSGQSDERARAKTRRVDLKTYRTLRRKLFQAESVVYSSNFPELSASDNIVAVHAHDIYCLPAGVVLSQKLGAPLVYDAHEYEPARATKIDPNGTELPALIEDDCFAHITRMITVSDGIGDLYHKRFKGPLPTIVMNAPEIKTDLTKIVTSPEPNISSVREKAGVGADVPLIVFTGHLHGPHRGVDKVLEAMTYIPDAHFVSLGGRSISDDGWFLSIAKKLGVKDRVSLLPPVDAREVPGAISSATVSVIAIQDKSLSYHYCLPNKLFEAAFAGLPICVSDLPEMKRFVETLGIGKVMDQTDPKAIAAALLDVVDNRDLYLMGPEAQKKLSEIYSWQAQSAKLLALYDSMLKPEKILVH
ncbi:glycosyltransferase family 4 protein [Roseobacter litoralis]|uniref:glycosyltransferase family 4 protein n=1 Tax=Roseobacter litoralis TaxID=42443 RepID=UPI002494F40F|nr:glycosyltransferase family 4 protein [Roseobacter litoralis]